MLLNSVIIILREVLEASLLISLLLVISKALHIHFRWLITAIICGFIGAALYAINLGAISEMFDYTGQEITNTILQIIIYLHLTVLIIFIHKADIQLNLDNKKITFLISAPIILAITREGSEIFIYFSGFINNPEKVLPGSIGSFIGAGIGTSIGVLVYYGLLSRKPETFFYICKAALLLVATGILSQTIPLLIQADIINASSPVWDTSNILAEESIMGQLLYAILGYEATPAPQQIAVYIGGILFILTALFISNLQTKVAH